MIFDGQVEDIPQWRRSIRSDMPPLKAPTLEGLLAQLDGLDTAAAARTVAAYTPPAWSSATTGRVERLEVRAAETLAEGVIDAAILIRVESRSSEWIEWQPGKIRNALPVLERRASLRRGAPPDAADIALGVALGYVAALR